MTNRSKSAISKSSGSKSAGAQSGRAKSTAVDLRIPCQLYLSVCATSDAANAERVAAVLDKVAVPSILLEPKPGETLTATHVLPFVETAHAHGVAVMIADDACLARTVKADGIHLNWTPDCLDRFTEAREIAGGRLMIGADAGTSRHNAMVFAEAGAEYIAFGLSPTAMEHDTAAANRLDMVEWWADVFEIPCVATGISGVQQDVVHQLASAGADFVCVRVPEGKSTADLIDWAETLAHQLDGKQAKAA
ncbi:MAG: thiamine phosphate synthase [Pseudomonadota bacterium]